MSVDTKFKIWMSCFLLYSIAMVAIPQNTAFYRRPATAEINLALKNAFGYCQSFLVDSPSERCSVEKLVSVGYGLPIGGVQITELDMGVSDGRIVIEYLPDELRGEVDYEGVLTRAEKSWEVTLKEAVNDQYSLFAFAFALLGLGVYWVLESVIMHFTIRPNKSGQIKARQIQEGISGWVLYKESLRKEILSKRDALSAYDISRLSEAVEKKFFALEEYDSAKKIALYSSVRSEVDTKDIIEKTLASGKEVYLPRVKEDGKGVDFVRVTGLEGFQKSEFGILEPVGDDIVASSDLDIIVLPGVAFDEKGGRIGYGKGHYDMTLENFKGLKVAFAFECQIVENIELEPHDVTMDIVVTEERVVRVK